MSRTLINTQTSSWPGAAVVGGSRANCVVCARWCPTLPHPGGCSTIGAVRLSFRVRDGAGRFPVAVTTETAVGSAVWCRLVLLIRLCGVAALPLPPPTRVWVGGGWWLGWVWTV